MKFKKVVVSLALVLLLSISVPIVLTGCNPDNKKTDKRQYVDIIVKHPVTGEIIKDHGWMEFEYDENFLMPDILLKLQDKDVYLSDEDFDNGSWKSHVMLYIQKDGTYKQQASFESDWPKEVGQYEIKIKFNDDGWVGEKSTDDIKYYSSDIVFTMKIT